MTDYATMSGPELVRAYNTMIGDGVPVTKFATKAVGVRRCEELAKKKGLNGYAPNGKRALRDRASIEVVSVDNPRRPGTKAYRLYAEMLAWVDVNQGAPISRLFAETKYRREDYNWDLGRGNIRKVSEKNE